MTVEELEEKIKKVVGGKDITLVGGGRFEGPLEGDLVVWVNRRWENFKKERIDGIVSNGVLGSSGIPIEGMKLVMGNMASMNMDSWRDRCVKSGVLFWPYWLEVKNGKVVNGPKWLGEGRYVPFTGLIAIKNFLRMGVKSITLKGFDGYSDEGGEYRDEHHLGFNRVLLEELRKNPRVVG